VLPVYTSLPMRDGLPASDAYIASNLGITGVLAGPSVHIVDPSGLADPFASRVLVPTRTRPGHEKGLPLAWFIARFGDPGAPTPEGVSARDVDAARRALRCGALHDLEAATTARLTPARFIRNIRLAIQLRDFRFSPDPSAAAARFCAE
jgi:arabinofuranosyltransferase